MRRFILRILGVCTLVVAVTVASGSHTTARADDDFTPCADCTFNWILGNSICGEAGSANYIVGCHQHWVYSYPPTSWCTVDQGPPAPGQCTQGPGGLVAAALGADGALARFVAGQSPVEHVLRDCKGRLVERGYPPGMIENFRALTAAISL